IRRGRERSEVHGREAALLERGSRGVGAVRGRMERADEPVHVFAVAAYREMQLLQIGSLEEPPHEQRVAHHVPDQAAEILELRRGAGAEQLGERVLPGELVPVSVVRDPHRAHETPEISGYDDDLKGRGEGRGERYASMQAEIPERPGAYLSVLPSPHEKDAGIQSRGDR